MSTTQLERGAAAKRPPTCGDERPARKRRWRRRFGSAAVSLPVLLLAGWLAVHHIPGFGPFVADTLRSLFGNTFVAWLEDTAYGVEDWLNRATRDDAPPAPMWEVPAAVPQPSTTAEATAAPAAEAARPGFRLPDLQPMYENIATKGDGVWLPLIDPRHPDDRTRVLKTFLHPDANRSWAVVAVIAADLSSVDLHAVAGSHEPESKTNEAKAYERKAKVPVEHFEKLVAAFNGGYKSTHGDYGMKIDGVVLQPPRALSCVVAKLKDGSVLIRDWDAVKDREPEMVWWRQAPICMVDEGKPHPALSMPKMAWGASSVSGTTVIRRSAIGLSAAGDILYVGIGDHVTAKAIATALQHAGAAHIAQLDVNFSYPKLLTYDYVTHGDRTRAELRAMMQRHAELRDQAHVCGGGYGKAALVAGHESVSILGRGERARLRGEREALVERSCDHDRPVRGCGERRRGVIVLAAQYRFCPRNGIGRWRAAPAGDASHAAWRTEPISPLRGTLNAPP